MCSEHLTWAESVASLCLGPSSWECYYQVGCGAESDPEWLLLLLLLLLLFINCEVKHLSRLNLETIPGTFLVIPVEGFLGS